MATERVLPAISLPRPHVDLPRPHAVAGTVGHAGRAERATRPAIARPATNRREALLTTPARAGMLLGASAAIYAVSLAAVSGLQYQTEADLAARHQPMLDTIVQARSANDALEATIAVADARVRDLAAAYDSAGNDVAGYQARLNDLASLVAKVQGSAAAMATTITLPSVSVHGAIGGSRSAPATVAKTSASAKP